MDAHRNLLKSVKLLALMLMLYWCVSPGLPQTRPCMSLVVNSIRGPCEMGGYDNFNMYKLSWRHSSAPSNYSTSSLGNIGHNALTRKHPHLTVSLTGRRRGRGDTLPSLQSLVLVHIIHTHMRMCTIILSYLLLSCGWRVFSERMQRAWRAVQGELYFENSHHRTRE